MWLAILRDCRAAEDDGALASSGVAIVLALQVTTRTAAHFAGVATPYSPDGERQFNVAWRANFQWAVVKLGIRVSPRTVGRYMPQRSPGRPRGDQRWSTFLKNHAEAILACDFFIAVTATFRLLYVFVVIEHGTRRLAHVNVTAHPSADWTLQQLRLVAGEEGGHRYLIHDRDKIFAKHLDDSIRALGIEVLRSPVASPKANSICERVIGTIRRECLDWMIPLSEAHLRSILKSWVEHYNRGRPHSRLGPGVPGPPRAAELIPQSQTRHRLAAGLVVLAKSVFGGLHHEYSIATMGASA
jgi:putative transposase